MLAAVPCVRGRESSAGPCDRIGAARSRAWRTCGHSVEHVAGDGVGAVGAEFGPATGLFQPWALNEVCCTPDALQLLLKVHGH